MLDSLTLKTLVFCKCALSQIYGADTCGTRTHLKRIQACSINIVGSRKESTDPRAHKGFGTFDHAHSKCPTRSATRHRRGVGYGTQTCRNKPVVGERRDQRGSVEATFQIIEGVGTDKVIHLFPNDWVKVHRKTVKIPIAPKSESAPNIVSHESVQLHRELRARGEGRQRVVLSSIMETGACSHT